MHDVQDSYKEFKAKAQRCFEILKECEIQTQAAEVLATSVHKTLE